MKISLKFLILFGVIFLSFAGAAHSQMDFSQCEEQGSMLGTSYICPNSPPPPEPICYLLRISYANSRDCVEAGGKHVIFGKGFNETEYCCDIDENNVSSLEENENIIGIPQENNASIPPQGKLEVDWPNSPMGTKLTGESLTNLIQYFYEWGIGLGGLAAFIALLIAGFQYLTSIGSATKMKNAVDRIKSAGFGLVLLLGSFLILNTINPQLTDLKMPPPEDLIKSGWDFDVENQQLSKSRTEACKKAFLYPESNFGGAPLDVGIGKYKNLPVKSIEIEGGCSVTLYDYPECEQNAFGPYMSRGIDPTEYTNIETGGVSSFGCVKVEQM